MTPCEFANDIWGAYVQIMKSEFEEVKSFDSEAFFKEHGFKCDKKKFVDESAYSYMFAIFHEIENSFAVKSNEILNELINIIKDNDMEFLLAPLEDYKYEWGQAILAKDSESTLSNPLYRIAKLASTRSLGEEGMDIRNIIMFNSRITAFLQWLKEELKQCKII